MNKVGNKLNQTIDRFSSRKMELEADALGLDYFIKAGYEPEAFLTMMNKIVGDGTVARIWRSHPPGTERMRALEARILTKHAPGQVPENVAEQPAPPEATTPTVAASKPTPAVAATPVESAVEEAAPEDPVALPTLAPALAP